MIVHSPFVDLDKLCTIWSLSHILNVTHSLVRHNEARLHGWNAFIVVLWTSNRFLQVKETEVCHVITVNSFL